MRLRSHRSHERTERVFKDVLRDVITARPTAFVVLLLLLRCFLGFHLGAAGTGAYISENVI